MSTPPSLSTTSATRRSRSATSATSAFSASVALARSGDLLQSRLLAAGKGHPSPRRRQLSGDRSADAAARAGDQGDLTVERFVHASLPVPAESNETRLMSHARGRAQDLSYDSSVATVVHAGRTV